MNESESPKQLRMETDLVADTSGDVICMPDTVNILPKFPRVLLFAPVVLFKRE